MTYPAQIFASGELGFALENDISYMFKNTAGTTVCTADGDAIACWKDKYGNGIIFTASAGQEPVLKWNATLSQWYVWLPASSNLDSANLKIMTSTTSWRQNDATTGAMSCGFSGQVHYTTGSPRIISQNAVTAGNIGEILRVNPTGPSMSTRNQAAAGGVLASDSGPTYSLDTDLSSMANFDSSGGNVSAEVFINGASNGATTAAGTWASSSTPMRLFVAATGSGNFFGGIAYRLFCLNRALTGTEQTGMDNWLKAPYSPSGAVLVISNATSAALADLLTLAPKTPLIAQDAVSAALADNVVLAPKWALSVQTAISAALASNLTLTPGGALGIAGAVSAALAGNVVLSPRWSLSVFGGVSGTITSAVALTPRFALTVAAAISTSLTDNVTWGSPLNHPSSRTTSPPIALFVGRIGSAPASLFSGRIASPPAALVAKRVAS